MSGTRNKRKQRMRLKIPLRSVYKEIAKEMLARETTSKRAILAALNSWVTSLTAKMPPVIASRDYSYSASHAVREIHRYMENR